MEEWVSLNEFARRMKIGHSTVLKLIADNEIEYMKTGTRYKIKVGGNFFPHGYVFFVLLMNRKRKKNTSRNKTTNVKRFYK